MKKLSNETLRRMSGTYREPWRVSVAQGLVACVFAAAVAGLIAWGM